MLVLAFNHVNIRTVHLDTMIARREQVLGLRSGPQPEFPFPGAWLYVGETCILHPIEADFPPMLHPD